MKTIMPPSTSLRRRIQPLYNRLSAALGRISACRVYFGRHPANAAENALIFFPCQNALLACGLAGIVVFKKPRSEKAIPQTDFHSLQERIRQYSYHHCMENGLCLADHYLGGTDTADELLAAVLDLKTTRGFFDLYQENELQHHLKSLSETLHESISVETRHLFQVMGLLPAETVEMITGRIEKLKDAAWGIDVELLENIEKIKSISGNPHASLSSGTLEILKHVNAVLNSIDRLEVRGRDSAGISLMLLLTPEAWRDVQQNIDRQGLREGFEHRLQPGVLLSNSIRMNTSADTAGRQTIAIALTYKIAAEIGRLGDNIRFIRRQLAEDRVFQTLIAAPGAHQSIAAHTRWASVGAITEANCHPVDNRALPDTATSPALIHVCLNGDVDNFQELKKKYALQGVYLPDEITCDTKIIPLHIDAYLKQGHGIEEAFRRAVNDFEGSHAISMQTDLAPGKLFLALKGSGQAIFVGMARDHYICASEVYGFVEETSEFLKLDGESVNPNPDGPGINGQIFILDPQGEGGLSGIRALSYDGTPLNLHPGMVRKTPLTSRDIDRQDFDHYFLKEISESPASVRRTLENRWKIKGEDQRQFLVSLPPAVVPKKIEDAFQQGGIRRILLIGQGTAGVAALACADILRYYLHDRDITIEALKSSELSGFNLGTDPSRAMNDTLLIPISQSGTTADTNRAVDLIKKQGAFAIAIVNRRDSDLTFKVDGVMYTSSGRDIEMSVASTKAFYSQIIAGAILGLYFAQAARCRTEAFISNEIKEMISLPGHMEAVLARKDLIQASAQRNATARTYWAAVGSGPNKAAADEIRIKLSELCYKTISSDYVEDKKHIDLSSEPLIFVCAAGTRRTVIGDIIKDTAIFHSHKALPIVICDEHEDRFAPYASDIIPVPSVTEHFAPILNTLAGHLWGYYAALAINEGSRFLYDFRKDLQVTMAEFEKKGLDIYEIALEKTFREKIIRFYHAFRKRQEENRLSATIGMRASTDLVLLLKYLSGRLPIADFEMDFGVKGTAANMFNKLFTALGLAINCLARPVDAIKHQAKTVTVGTSRIEEKAEGILFDFLKSKNFTPAQLTIGNILVIKHLQEIIIGIKGSTLYRITGINLLGEPTDDTCIEVMEKTGTSAALPSRAETERRLKGTKKIIVRRGNVYIGKGRKDNRSILVIPLISNDPARPNTIEFLLLLDIDFNPAVDLSAKVKALGGKHEHIKNLVQENNIIWDDRFLELVEMADLFGWSAEKVAEAIIAKTGSIQ